ncbi:glycosyltransferase [Lacisediminihabitans changchengi]|uniref:D-inositol 3-phosphate glycosyltransferase n=1 Tax=Lacisediminihabitans changchengi TaxID=2787634 RepID=A0A934SHD1_9MICO|nr:glycosyltransferase [Lacisediminihabitans changchengi]MBK4346656.1 glycosyltransferase [Lacisediminihabitans changchengi]
MRIAIVSDYFLDYVGGAQTSMKQQRLALEEAGHDVVMVSTRRGLAGRRMRLVDGDAMFQPNFTIPGLELPVVPNNGRVRAKLEAYFRAQRIEVVHVQTEFSLARAAADVAKKLGIPVVHTVHTFYWASESGPQASVAWFLRLGLRVVTKAKLPNKVFTSRAGDNVIRNLTLGMALRADRVISPSAHQARDLAAAGVSGDIAVVPNPVATSDRPSVPLEPGLRPRFLWVARCEPIKRPLVFARAAIEALGRTDNAFSVDFVGEGADLAELRALAEGHDEIRIQGVLPHDQVLDLMDVSSAVVLSSLGFDNQPMTIAEAVSRERGVLYCDPQLREGLLNSGFLSETPDVAGLADAIVELVSDPALLPGLSAGARADREAFAPANYVARVVEIYRTTTAAA